MLASNLSQETPVQLSSKKFQDFDYATLDTETRIVVQQRTSEIKEQLRNAARTAWEIGKKLVEVRDRLEYGQFKSWLLAEFQWSRRTAYNYISVFNSFGSCANFSQLEIDSSALYLLAAPSTPDSAREEALERASQGENITHNEALAIVTRYKESVGPKATKARHKEPLALMTSKPEQQSHDSAVANQGQKELLEKEVGLEELPLEASVAKRSKQQNVSLAAETEANLSEGLIEDDATVDQSEEESLENVAASLWQYGSACQWQEEIGTVIRVEGNDIWVDFDGRIRKLSVFDIEQPGEQDKAGSADLAESTVLERQAEKSLLSIEPLAAQTVESRVVSGDEQSLPGGEAIALEQERESNISTGTILAVDPPQQIAKEQLGLWTMLTPHITTEQLNLYDWPTSEVKRFNAELKRICEVFEQELERRELH